MARAMLPQTIPYPDPFLSLPASFGLLERLKGWPLLEAALIITGTLKEDDKKKKKKGIIHCHPSVAFKQR